jgi:hypothetical protein
MRRWGCNTKSFDKSCKISFKTTATRFPACIARRTKRRRSADHVSFLHVVDTVHVAACIELSAHGLDVPIRGCEVRSALSTASRTFGSAPCSSNNRTAFTSRAQLRRAIVVGPIRVILGRSRASRATPRRLLWHRPRRRVQRPLFAAVRARPSGHASGRKPWSRVTAGRAVASFDRGPACRSSCNRSFANYFTYSSRRVESYSDLFGSY